MFHKVPEYKLDYCTSPASTLCAGLIDDAAMGLVYLPSWALTFWDVDEDGCCYRLTVMLTQAE